MTADQLRQGAALVKALAAGDEDARGPLADWAAEIGTLSEYLCQVLRQPYAVVVPVPRRGGGVIVRLSLRGVGPLVPLYGDVGEFPASVWEQQPE